MPENRKEPSIRFAGFIDYWEQRIIDDCFTERNERSGIGELISVTMNSGVMRAEDLGRHDTSSNDKSNYKKVEVGDIAYNSMRMWQGASGFSPYNGILSPAYTVITPQEGIHSTFFAYLFKRTNMIHKFQINSQGLTSDTWNLKWPSLRSISVTVPELEEQCKISEFFVVLDHLITLHQRKYEKLVSVKKSLLEKMFPKNDSSIPELRFAGFTDPWEQRKLGEVTTRIVRKNKNLESTLPLTISSNYGLVDQITYFNNRVASRDVSNYYLIKRGEFAYNKSYSDGYPWGSVKRLDRYEMGVLSTLYIVFALDTGIVDSDYLASYYEADTWHKEVAARAAEGARNHGLLNISAEDFFETALYYPKDRVEQEQIGAFFQSLDHLITLHQRKYEKMVSVKKSMLEKMFV